MCARLHSPATRQRSGRWMMLHAVRKLGMTIGFMRPMRRQRFAQLRRMTRHFPLQPP